jgi:hypothetical protein
VEREPVEHLTQCHLRRGDAVGFGDLPGDGRPERSDALHELGGGVGYVHARLDCLTLSGQVSDGKSVRGTQHGPNSGDSTRAA